MKTTDTASASTCFPLYLTVSNPQQKQGLTSKTCLVRFLDVTRSFGANRREAPTPIDEKA
jgi:hypothetical protein